MNLIQIYIIGILLAFSQFALIFEAIAQDIWNVGDRYILKNGEKVFLHGVNYIPSSEWLFILEDNRWNEEIIKRDLYALSQIGVNHIRFFPLWHITQPVSDEVSLKVLERIDKILDIAEENKISVQLAPITGWMSGGMFLPDWINGNIFTDEELLHGQDTLIINLTNRYKESKVLLGYDFGNEINVIRSQLKLPVTPDEIESWMSRIYNDFKIGDKNHPVTNGIGTGFDEFFRIEAISQTSDYLSVHSYPYFHGTTKIDPMIGQRTTYSPNFIVAWAEMQAKPVLLQEIGCSESWINKFEVPKFLEICFYSTWADGATGFLWWCSHNLHEDFYPDNTGLKKEYSAGTVRNTGTFNKLEFSLGLLDSDNQIKMSGLQFMECSQNVDNLSLEWEELNPECYIIIPEDMEYRDAMNNYITPYVVAKQAHFDVKLLRENQTIPSEADAVIIAGFDLSESGSSNIMEYLERGGTVLQTGYNSLSQDINVFRDSSISVDKDLYVNTAIGNLFTGQRLTGFISRKIFKTSFTSKVQALIIMPENDINIKSRGNQGSGVLLKTKISNGNYYFLASDFFSDLDNMYDPWLHDNTDQILSVMKTNIHIDIDNKFIEMYQKINNEDKRLLVLINHSNECQNVNIKSDRRIIALDYFNKDSLGEGFEINHKMFPGETNFFEIRYKNEFPTSYEE